MMTPFRNDCIPCLPAIVLLVTASAVHPASGASVIFDGAAYTQNFNSLPRDPSGDRSWVNGASLPGWYAYETYVNDTYPGRPNNHWRPASSIFPATGQVQPFTTLMALGSGPTDTDRALGMQTTSQDQLVALVLKNRTANVLDEFCLSYVVEQWKMNSTTFLPSMQYHFSYGVFESFNDRPENPNTVIPMEPGMPGQFNAGYTEPGGDADPRVFVFSNQNLPLDGNASENRRTITETYTVDWRPEEYLVLRWWLDFDRTVTPVMGIDDLSVTTHFVAPVPEPPEGGLIAGALCALALAYQQVRSWRSKQKGMPMA